MAEAETSDLSLSLSVSLSSFSLSPMEKFDSKARAKDYAFRFNSPHSSRPCYEFSMIEANPSGREQSLCAFFRASEASPGLPGPLVPADPKVGVSRFPATFRKPSENRTEEGDCEKSPGGEELRSNPLDPDPSALPAAAPSSNPATRISVKVAASFFESDSCAMF